MAMIETKTPNEYAGLLTRIDIRKTRNHITYASFGLSSGGAEFACVAFKASLIETLKSIGMGGQARVKGYHESIENARTGRTSTFLRAYFIDRVARAASKDSTSVSLNDLGDMFAEPMSPDAFTPVPVDIKAASKAIQLAKRRIRDAARRAKVRAEKAALATAEAA